ncbi:MAG: hypothetical protein ACK5MI_02150 [Mangrovibacterium sp.]
MSLKNRYNGKFLLLLAGLILFAHSIIPHDHHPELIHSSEDSVYENHPNEKPTHELHCHAFNLLDTKSQVVVSDFVSLHAVDFFLLPEREQLSLNCCEHSVAGCCHQTAEFSITVLNSRSLRAPPLALFS